METRIRKPLSVAAVVFSLAGGMGGASAAPSHSFTFGGGSLQLDFGTSFGQGAGNGLSGSDEVQSTVTFASVQTVLFGDLVVSPHVQGLTQGQGDSTWDTPTSPVPEPETYLMLLAGLGLIGAIARRRRIQ